MTKSLDATGKTIDLAIQNGLTELGLDRDSVSVEVLENPRSGFFGIGATPAKVRLTYDVPEAAQKSAPEPAQRSAPEPAQKPAPQRTSPQQQTRPRPAPTRPVPEPRPAADWSANLDEPSQEAVHREPPAAAAEGTVEAHIESFLAGLFERMGANAVGRAVKVDEDTYAVELFGESLGMLIGRRGDTLDAIQHLTNYAVNRGAEKRVRINVDAENYRKKREEALQRLANKVAGKVVRNRRNVTLEPMNAYERHVIHAALQDYPDVTTYSTGTDPNRRIVVAYSRYQSVAPGQFGDR